MTGNTVVEDATEVLKERWRRVRKKRDKFLSGSDRDMFRMNETGANSTAMKAYRQALRDVPNQPDPANINWPAKP